MCWGSTGVIVRNHCRRRRHLHRECVSQGLFSRNCLESNIQRHFYRHLSSLLQETTKFCGVLGPYRLIIEPLPRKNARTKQVYYDALATCTFSRLTQGQARKKRKRQTWRGRKWQREPGLLINSTRHFLSVNIDDWDAEVYLSLIRRRVQPMLWWAHTSPNETALKRPPWHIKYSSVTYVCFTWRGPVIPIGGKPYPVNWALFTKTSTPQSTPSLWANTEFC